MFLLVAVVCNDYSAVAFAAGTGLLIRGWHWLALLLFLVGCYLCRSDLIPLAFAALVLFLTVALQGAPERKNGQRKAPRSSPPAGDHDRGIDDLAGIPDD